MKARTIGKAAAGTLFAIFLSTFMLFLSISAATEPDNLRPAFAGMISSAIPLDQYIDSYREDCQSEFVGSIRSDFGEIDCSMIRAADQQYIDEIKVNLTREIREQADSRFDEIYNADYGCQLIDCLTNNGGNQTKMLAIFSKQANDFASSMLGIFGILSIASGAALFFFTKGWGRLTSFGTTFAFTGITYYLIIIAANAVPVSAVGKFLEAFFSSTAAYYSLLLFGGIAMAVAGIAVPRVRKKQTGKSSGK